jgi:hypothetical protein
MLFLLHVDVFGQFEQKYCEADSPETPYALHYVEKRGRA